MTAGTILVTGASGLVGTAVMAALQGDARTRGRARPAGRRAGAVGGIPLDLNDPRLALPPGIDVIVHLAGEKRTEADMWSVNFDGTRRLLDAARAAGVRRFVHLSSVGVYGAPMHSGVVTESFVHRPANEYERSKNAAEQYVVAHAASLGLEWVVLQPSNVIGVAPDQPPPLLGLTRAVALGRPVRFGHGPAMFNYVAVEDVAAAVLHAAVTPTHGRTWIVNTPAPVEQALGWIAAELGGAARVRRLPMVVGELVVRLGTPLAAALGRSLPLDRARLRDLTNTTVYDGEAICREAAFRYPIGAERLLRSLAARYRAEGLA